MAADLAALIRNEAWLVRHYDKRNAQKRAEAIQKLGLVVKFAFMHSDDYEPLLAAVADGLSLRDDSVVLTPPRRPRQ